MVGQACAEKLNTQEVVLKQTHNTVQQLYLRNKAPTVLARALEQPVEPEMERKVFEVSCCLCFLIWPGHNMYKGNL